jgi:hypothetical protein
MLSTDTSGTAVPFAAACRPSLAKATAARGEVVQSELSAAVAKLPGGTDDAGACIDLDSLIGQIDLDRGKPEDDPTAIRRRGEPQGVQFAIVDLTRPDLAVPVVKALSPELEPSIARPACIRDHLIRYGPLPEARARVTLF